MIPAPALPKYTPDGRPTSLLRRVLRRVAFAIVALGALGTGLAWYGSHLASPPPQFPIETELTIAPGMSTTAIADQLYAEGYIHSPLLLHTVLTIFHDPQEVKASTYIFSQPLDVFDLTKRLMLGDYGNDLVRFIHYEGESRRDIASRAAGVLRNFDPDIFLEITTGKEGRLFPDTYLLPKIYTAEQMARLLEETYEQRIAPLRPAILDSQLTEEQVIILASILEREANSLESKKLVAGIFLRRLEVGMPLQADATIGYVLDGPLSTLTAADLDRDSPYNTYRNPGLPPTPIGNPGLTAIQAVLEPTDSDYLFYLTGNDGNFYYATTYAGHKRNIDRYLR